jgi:phosphohistidine phosphatase
LTYDEFDTFALSFVQLLARMQLQLVLMRHAQAEEKQQEQHDVDRELTGKGQQEALTMGTQLQERKIVPDVIFSSAAVRTQTTSSLLSDVLKISTDRIINNDELYNSSIRTYLSFINDIDLQYKTVVLVGHNPAISYLSEYLTGAEIGSVPTAGVCIIQCNCPSWKDVDKNSGKLIEFIYPEMFS